jgi:ATP-dependent Clp protease ATP-binding subunit ClpA
MPKQHEIQFSGRVVVQWISWMLVLALATVTVLQPLSSNRSTIALAFAPWPTTTTRRTATATTTGPSSLDVVAQKTSTSMTTRHSTTTISQSFQNSLKKSNRRSTTTRLYVFERMSEDCIGAIVTAQKQAQRMNQKQVELAFLVAGLIDVPESTAVKRTLQQYNLSWRAVIAILEKMYAADITTSNTLKTGFFQARNPDDDLPFGKDVQQVLKASSKVADTMKSTTIHTQHLFLAMLEYQPAPKSGSGGGGAAAATASAVTDPSTNGAYKVIVSVDGNTKLANSGGSGGLEICDSLLKNMQRDEEGKDTKTKERDLVTGIGGDAPSTKTLQECGVDLTEQAQDGLLDPVYGRDKEIRSCLRTLVRRRKNNVVLIGEAGVGKTSIAEGIAQVLVHEADPFATDDDNDDDSEGKNSLRGGCITSTCPCPPRLKGYRLISLELANLVAGTKYRGEFEERLQAIIQEVTHPKAPPTILFIDEIHNLVGAGAAEGGMDAANLLKPALARGQLQVIGATTIAEYRKYIEKDAALERRLQPVMVVEPSVDETFGILQAIAPNYETHHKVKYTTESLKAAAKLSERYITDRFLPDKVRGRRGAC